MGKLGENTDELSKAFDKTRVADELRGLIRSARNIDGSVNLGKNRAPVTRYMDSESAVVELKIAREPAVLLLPPRFGNALIPLLNKPVVCTNNYDGERKSLQIARRGEIILGFKRRGQIHHFMINKELVEQVLDPLKWREVTLSRSMAAVDNFAEVNGVPVEEALEIAEAAIGRRDLSL